jgi:hypothetical protein
LLVIQLYVVRGKGNYRAHIKFQRCEKPKSSLKIADGNIYVEGYSLGKKDRS